MKKILEGFTKLLLQKEFKPNELNKLNICKDCSIRTDYTCSKSKGGCGCYIPAKIKTNSACPKNKW